LRIAEEEIMTNPRSRTLAILAIIAVACSASHVTAARNNDFPQRAVRIIVPLAPGGGTDIVARLVAQGLSEHWAKPVVVENRPGAGSVVGTALAARATPDGHTLLVSSSSLAISPAVSEARV
jgi:tripartite-type tricarboxylate transporter receptor subunit TctC